MAKSSHRVTDDDDGPRNDGGLALVRRCPDIAVPPPPRSIIANHRPTFPLALPPPSEMRASSSTSTSTTTAVVRDDERRHLACDVVPRILSYCDARTLSRASGVCRSWRIMANADELWTDLCKEGECFFPLSSWGARRRRRPRTDAEGKLPSDGMGEGCRGGGSVVVLNNTTSHVV